jgi:iron complex transport system substrate-binding protein
MDDNQIEVPADPRRIACMHAVSSEKIVILGKGDRLVLSMKPSPWMIKLFPEVKNSRIVDAPFTGNIERMLNLKVDLVLYSPYPGEAEKYKAAGIKTACGFSPHKRPRSIEEYSDNFKRQIIFFGELLGPDEKVKAEKYCKYFDEKTNKIRLITSKISKNKRPAVYYGGRSGGMLLSQGKASVMHWDTEIAGGNFLTQSMDNNFTEVNLEQIFAWDPDIILISGWCGSTDVVTHNPNWASLRAVRNGKVYLIPQGVFAWDFASGESPLLMIYLAKIFHPELFKNWNITDEMKKFYAEIYGKKISDSDAERILNHLPPM